MFVRYSGSVDADVAAFLVHEDQTWDRLPRCSCCDEPIQGKVINYEGMMLCEECFGDGDL